MYEACHACRLLGQLSQMQQQLVQPSRGASLVPGSRGLAAEVDRLSICFVIATVQVEAAAQLLQVTPCSCLCSHGDSVFCCCVLHQDFSCTLQAYAHVCVRECA